MKVKGSEMADTPYRILTRRFKARHYNKLVFTIPFRERNANTILTLHAGY